MSWQPPGFQPPGWQPPGWQPGAPGGGGGPTAVLTGTIVAAGVLENNMVAGAETTIITLDGDTWLATGGAFDGSRAAILAGITSAQSEVLGWNNEIRDKEVVTAVVRTSATVVTITWTASPLYDITISESITVTVPASALTTSADPVIATPLLTIFELVGGMQPVSGRKPLTRKISARSISHALSGAEKDYPVYPFSRRQFFEKPKHNPFKGL